MNVLEPGKISLSQVLALLVITRLVPVTLICPTVNMVPNPATAWLNDIIGTLIAIPMVLLIVYLNHRFPGKTMVEYAEVLLGPVAGKIAGTLIVFHFLMVAAYALRTLGEVLAIALMPETPIILFIISTAFLVAVAVRNGLEVIARFATLLMPIMLGLLLLILLTPSEFMDFRYLHPFFFSQGMSELIWPSASVLSFYTEFLVLGMLMPYINRPSGTLRFCLGAILLVLLLLMAQCLVMAAVFGPLINSLTIPSLSLARLVSLGMFFERIEGVIQVIWNFAAGVKIALFLWASALGVAQLAYLPSYRSIVYSLGACLAVLCVFSYQNLIDLLNVLTGPMIIFSISFLAVLLVVLYIALAIKQARKAGAGDV